MYDTLVKKCIDLAIEKKATNIINDYIIFWKNGSELPQYNIKELDEKYAYLIFSHKNNFIDIF